MVEKEKNYKNMIEALLFASGRYMSVENLMALTKAENKEIIIENINKLKQEYDLRESPLMIVEEKDGYKLTVREQYLSLVRKIVSETELPKTILETLAVIAWKNPAKQSEIIDIRHNKAYDHIAELEELGFIKKEKKGRSYILKLTEKFYEYFDVDGVKNIKDVFKRVVDKNIQKAEENKNNQEQNLIKNNQQTLNEITTELKQELKENTKQKSKEIERNETEEIIKDYEKTKEMEDSKLIDINNKKEYEKNNKNEFHELD